MTFRQTPFQFTTIDPVKRHSELQKRFGLPSNDMYVDCVNPNLMNSGSNTPFSMVNSPRMQHRIPIVTSDLQQKKPESVKNVDSDHKPKVRVVPIQMENDGYIKRHRTFSGPADLASNNKEIINSSTPILQNKPQSSEPFLSNGKIKYTPKVYNVPVQIEGKNQKNFQHSPSKISSSKTVKTIDSTKTNDSTVSKELSEPDEKELLKQIENVVIRLKDYKEGVEKFIGTSKDKQYRYLDEMLTRCMLDLDNIDSKGVDAVRRSRKTAVKEVQACIDLLECKINAKPETETGMKTTIEEVEQSHVGDIKMKEESALQCSEENDVNSEPMEVSEQDSEDKDFIETESQESKDNVEFQYSCQNESFIQSVDDKNTNKLEGFQVPTVELTKINSQDKTNCEIVIEELNENTEIESNHQDMHNIKIEELSDIVDTSSMDEEKELISDKITDPVRIEEIDSFEQAESCDDQTNQISNEDSTKDLQSLVTEITVLVEDKSKNSQNISEQTLENECEVANNCATEKMGCVDNPNINEN